jgi:hypothetical protein
LVVLLLSSALALLDASLRSLALCARMFVVSLHSALLRIAAHIHYVHICSFTIRCAHCSLYSLSYNCSLHRSLYYRIRSAHTNVCSLLYVRSIAHYTIVFALLILTYVRSIYYLVRALVTRCTRVNNSIRCAHVLLTDESLCVSMMDLKVHMCVPCFYELCSKNSALYGALLHFGVKNIPL